MRLLAGLGDDVAQREVEELAVVLPALLPEHRQQATHGVLPDGPLVAEAAVERVQLGDAAALADPELDATMAQQVERADPLGDACRVVRRQLHDAVAEADVLRALAGRGEEHLRRRGVAVLLQEVVLHLPRVVEPEPVGQLDLVEGVVEQLVLVVGPPGLGQLQLVEDTELHGPSVDPLRRSGRARPDRHMLVLDCSSTSVTQPDRPWRVTTSWQCMLLIRFLPPVRANSLLAPSWRSSP